MSNVAVSSLRTLALATLIGGFAIGSAHATATTNITAGAPPSAMVPSNVSMTSDDPASEPPATPSDMQQQPTMHKHMHKASAAPANMSARVEQRIKTLHDKLQITTAQESEWSDVAQAMRDNKANISQLIEERRANAQGMNAVEDLQSYQKIAQAHADGIAKLTPAFETLYDDLSDSQKKNADDVFGRFEGQRGTAVKHVSKKSP